MVTLLDGAIWKIRLAVLPSTDRFIAPGPRMLKLFETSSSPLTRVILEWLGSAKLIASPLLWPRRRFARPAASRGGEVCGVSWHSSQNLLLRIQPYRHSCSH